MCIRDSPVTGGVSAAAVSAVTEPDPAGFDHVLAGVRLVGQARGRADQPHTSEHVIDAGRVGFGDCGHRRRGHAAGHRVTPACPSGLGTESTAARSRPGSGCRYTCEDDTQACPSSLATTSIPHPASAAILPCLLY